MATLVQWRHLVALADSGSFSKAALAVHLTQPALSRSLQALEAEFGAPLVDRIGRRAELSPLGRELLPRARQLVADAADLHSRGQRTLRAQAGRLRLGLGSGPGALLMTPLLLQAARERPGLVVEVTRGANEAQVQQLRERKLDALVADLRTLSPAPDLLVESVVQLRGAFMVRPCHPLARRRSLRFEQLRAYPMASTPLSDEVARSLVEQYGPQAHPEGAVSLRCDEVASLVEVALGSDAVLLVIRASAPGLKELRLQPPLAAVARFGLVTLARRSRAPALAWLQELMARHLVDAPAP